MQQNEVVQFVIILFTWLSVTVKKYFMEFFFSQIISHYY